MELQISISVSLVVDAEGCVCWPHGPPHLTCKHSLILEGTTVPFAMGMERWENIKSKQERYHDNARTKRTPVSSRTDDRIRQHTATTKDYNKYPGGCST